MKTPQEEAEALTEQAYRHWDSTTDSITESVLKQIPLPELIAVARAAVNLTHENMPEDLLNLDAALQALRATGKVEL